MSTETHADGLTGEIVMRVERHSRNAMLQNADLRKFSYSVAHAMCVRVHRVKRLELVFGKSANTARTSCGAPPRKGHSGTSGHAHAHRTYGNRTTVTIVECSSPPVLRCPRRIGHRS